VTLVRQRRIEILLLTYLLTYLNPSQIPAKVCQFVIENVLKYEGRLINMLQNGAIPSMLKIGKILNTVYVLQGILF